ncbi:dual specificity protein phosphatase family protein [Ruegeria sp.]|uniref:protein-tyrosine phosphatase family protein n=1 Tax=Ruegeria sp. TaxID=1879320 RepID=UPI00231D0719|nr:dual specificity protein phosphatase family protein [Ruegeria sp.]MDA7966900.1 dual specificity protein phosphatase family protein [Ruegeria sp.]
MSDEDPKFEIFALPVGGGTLALTPIPGRGGTYCADLAVIRAWAPDIVVSMTTGAEMAQQGAEDFGRDIVGLGANWVHLPIEDFGTPPGDVTQRWVEVSVDIRTALSRGGRVLVHCRGGCGRSGMIVLRLMVECGEAPDAALARLRALRPCAVETEGQMRWAIGAARAGSAY